MTCIGGDCGYTIQSSLRSPRRESFFCCDHAPDQEKRLREELVWNIELGEYGDPQEFARGLLADLEEYRGPSTDDKEKSKSTKKKARTDDEKK